jgi:hypothetical protein
MQTVTVYGPDGKLHYNETTNLKCTNGILEFSTTEECLVTQTPIGKPEWEVKLRDVHNVKTNLPFFVEEVREKT